MTTPTSYSLLVRGALVRSEGQPHPAQLSQHGRLGRVIFTWVQALATASASPFAFTQQP